MLRLSLCIWGGGVMRTNISLIFFLKKTREWIDVIKGAELSQSYLQDFRLAPEDDLGVREHRVYHFRQALHLCQRREDFAYTREHLEDLDLKECDTMSHQIGTRTSA